MFSLDYFTKSYNGAGNGQSLYLYRSTDDLTDIFADDYFAELYTLVKVDDIFLITANDLTSFARVTSVNKLDYTITVVQVGIL